VLLNFTDDRVHCGSVRTNSFHKFNATL
jgi:hypothetical protein